MEVINNNDDKNRNKIAGALFVGCMFIGMGIGFLLDRMTGGLFIGMGVGFLASAIYRSQQK